MFEGFQGSRFGSAILNFLTYHALFVNITIYIVVIVFHMTAIDLQIYIILSEVHYLFFIHAIVI